MKLVSPDFWGAFSGAPLLIAFEGNEKEEMKNNGFFLITINFKSYRFNTLENRVVELKRQYHYRENELEVCIDLSAVLKSISYYYQDPNKWFETRQYITPSIEISLKAMYDKNGEMVAMDFGNGITEIKETFTMYPANFSSFISKYESENRGYNMRRLCKDFKKRGSVPYTTYFKGYPQMDVIMSIKDGEGGKKESVVLDYIERGRYEYVNRIIDDCGVFIAWRNAAGTVSYWLFSDQYTEELKTKQMGKMKKGYYSQLGGDESLLHSFGSTVTRRWVLRSNVPVMPDELDELQSLLISNEVFLFMLSKGDTSGGADEWLRVAVVEGTHKFDINKQGPHPFGVTIEFDEEKTRTEL